METSIQTIQRTSLNSISSKTLKRKDNGLKTYSPNTIERSIEIQKTFNDWNNNQPITLERTKEFLNERSQYKKDSTVKQEKSLLKLLLLETFPELNTHLGKKRIDLEFSEITTSEGNQNKTMCTLSQEILMSVLPKFSHRQSLFIRFQYNTACRVSEMLNVKLSNCKSNGSETIISIRGKGNKPGILRVTTSLFNEIINEFQGDIYLFQNHRSKSKRFSRQYVFEIVSKIENYTEKPFSPHKLRHSRATNLLKSGETLSGVSELLRHSNKSTTTKFYDHTTIESNNLFKGEI